MMKKYKVVIGLALMLFWAASVAQAGAPAALPAGDRNLLPADNPQPGRSSVAEGPGRSREKEAAVIRDKNSKAARLEISQDGPWALFAGPDIESIDYSTPVLSGQRSGSFAVPVPPESRACFALRTAEGLRLLSERLLPMTGGYNFRDLGGFQTQDGRSLKWGRLFRADDLKTLTEADLDYLASIPIITLVDFRTYEERLKYPDLLPASVLRHLFYALSAEALKDVKFSEAGSPEKERALRARAYELYLIEEQNRTAWRAWFRAIENEDNLPLMFHCSAGKDRTGLAAALLLSALGVDRATIMADYLASTAYLEGKYSHPEHGQAHAEYLETAFRFLDREYGSVDNYLTKELGVDSAKLRKIYLADRLGPVGEGEINQ